VVYLGAFFVWNFTFRGFALQYWWPDWPTLNSQLLPLVALVIYLGMALFTATYLNTREWAPRLHRGLIGLTLVIFLVLTLPALLDWYALTFALMVPLAVVFLVYLLVVAAVLLRRGSRPARFYLLAWAMLIIGVVLYFLRLVDILPANTFTNNALQIGSALEFMLLALGLADKINTLKAENLAAKHRIVEQQREHAERLERTVEERTGELRAANQRLADMAVTDELTGLYNRRQFNDEFERAVESARRTGRVLAFCMVDVDEFKAYNDLYGHEAGDHALVAVADAIRSRLQRPEDRIFRMGGEEFGILLQTDDCENAARFLEKVRKGIVDLAVPHEASTEGCLTASFGLYCHKGGPELPNATTIYQLADEALYVAKSGGRNRVEVAEV
ncbi:MAG: sensor domain-containing diguanylate cyclase, partial [Pseudomonadota bacterium]